MSLLLQLQQPFPDRGSSSSSLRGLLGVSLFVSLFLFVLQPFGLSSDLPNFSLICLGFGCITLVFGLLFNFLEKRIIKIRTDLPSWTLAKWILRSLISLIWIALGNFLFINVLSGGSAMSLPSFFIMLGYTLLVGIFPIVFSGLLIQMRAIRSNVASAEAVEHELTEHQKDQRESLKLEGLDIELALSDIRYIEAMQNYLTIWYSTEGSLRKEVFRSTMTKVEVQILQGDLVRCHRSYFVNSAAIIKAEGNAQGLRLTLTNCPDITIPVSRSYIDKLRALLAKGS